MLLLAVEVRITSGGTRLRVAAAIAFALCICPGVATAQVQRAANLPFRHVFCNGSAIAAHGDTVWMSTRNSETRLIYAGDTVWSHHRVGAHALDTKWLLMGDSGMMLAVQDSTGRQGVPFRPSSPKAEARTLRGFQAMAQEYERHDALTGFRSRAVASRCDPDTLTTMR